MSELKMSDVFNLPLQAVDSVYGDVNILDSFNECVSDGYYDDFEVAAAQAINSHDALTETLRLKEEECKQLDQDKVEIMELLKVLVNHNCPTEYCSESELDAFYRASELIEAHK